MNDGEFVIGVFAGILLSVGVGILFWHMFESECQKKHNVHDCAATGTLFEPVEVD